MASHWIPEDDFRLRKSIENGASLESLAKGAVKFSRRFTLSELRDRWHSLLYNPRVTSLSSSVAFDHTYSDQFLPPTHHNNHHHRTPVRSQYYTACKRRRLEELYPLPSNGDNDVINEDLDHVAFGGNAFEGSEYFDMEFDEVDLAIIQNSFPGIDHVDDGGGGMVNQLFNDCDVSDTTTAANALEQFLLQEDSQEPMLEQPFTSFNETTSVSHDQAETWTDPEYLPNQPEEYCHNAMPWPELDPHPEVINGVITCTLNKESDEIPDNDDIHFTLYTQKDRNPSSSLRKHMRPPPYPNRGSSPSQARGNNDMFHSSGTGDSVVPEQATCSNAFKASYTEKATSSFTTATSTSQQHYEQTLSSEMDTTTPVSQEEEENNEIESDEDLPSYSDVEAMILDMDLEPVGQDRYELEASRYRTEEVARMVMRLEQSSKSYMNRYITSHEAFAMLYGSSKHYINKPEVLLGRATGEYRVDIDLAKSGSWKKVSRRQAIIKLKKDGCFVIKNLGKFSIWINEKEVQHGEIVNLTNNSLIQIREMSFIFETNEKAVKRYLDVIHK